MTTASAPPETRYARGEGGHVAYQVFGEGPPLLLVQSWLQNVDAMWDEPSMVRFLMRLASFSQVIVFDKRGSGVSDPVPLNRLPNLDEWTDDARQVLDAAGVGPVVVLGDGEGGPMAMLLAASDPERVASLGLLNTFARWRRAPDYPAGMPDATVELLVERYGENWGVTADILDLTAPSVARDPRFRAWFLRYQRLCMPPHSAVTMYRWVTALDVRGVLPSLRLPTVVIQRADARHHRVGYGRFLAENIAGARYVELAGADTSPINAGDTTPVLDAIEEFVTGSRGAPPAERRLATIVCTDVVGSTAIAAAAGDAAWLGLLRRHDDVVRSHLDTYRGREVNTTGDGFVAAFDGPGRAVTFADRLVMAMDRLGLRIRAGVHTGEVEENGGVVGGLAVHIAARVMSLATDGGVMVSSTVRDLVLGSGIEFADAGTHELKGVPGRWTVHTVTHAP